MWSLRQSDKPFPDYTYDIFYLDWLAFLLISWIDCIYRWNESFYQTVEPQDMDWNTEFSRQISADLQRIIWASFIYNSGWGFPNRRWCDFTWRCHEKPKRVSTTNCLSPKGSSTRHVFQWYNRCSKRSCFDTFQLNDSSSASWVRPYQTCLKSFTSILTEICNDRELAKSLQRKDS